MERQNRQLLIAALVALALAAVLIIDNQRNGGKKQDLNDPDAPPTRELVDYKLDEVSVLTVQKGTGPETRFEKADGVWSMVQPAPLPIEERRVTEIIDRFDPAKVEERNLSGDLAGFGLDDANRGKVTFATADGRAWTVFVGNQTTVGYGTYVQVQDGGPVQVAKTHLAEFGRRGPDDFRSKALWTISSGTAREIRIEQAGAIVNLREDTHGWWLGDAGPRVDESAVDDWLRQANLVRAESFVDDALVQVTDAAVLSVTDAEGTHTLRVGALDEGLVLVKGDGPLARAGASVLDLVKLSGWEGTELMPVRSFQVDNIALVLGDYKATFVKQDDIWRTSDGATTTLPPGLLDQVKKTKADRSAVVTGDDSGWGSLTLSETAGDTTLRQSVSFGAPTMAGEFAGRVARDAAGGPSFVVLQADLDVLLGVARGTLPPPPSAPAGGFEGLPGM